MKTKWEIVGRGGPPPEGLEDVILENRWLARIDDASAHAWPHAKAWAPGSRTGALPVLRVDQGPGRPDLPRGPKGYPEVVHHKVVMCPVDRRMGVVLPLGAGLGVRR